jgi:hypothetical protein
MKERIVCSVNLSPGFNVQGKARFTQFAVLYSINLIFLEDVDEFGKTVTGVGVDATWNQF